MKTMKQVLAEFQRMHRQLCETVKGFVEVKSYNSPGMWEIEIHVTEFEGKEIVGTSKAVWDNYKNIHHEDVEAENEAKLAEFKEKFNLK